MGDKSLLSKHDAFSMVLLKDVKAARKIGRLADREINREKKREEDVR